MGSSQEEEFTRWGVDEIGIVTHRELKSEATWV